MPAEREKAFAESLAPLIDDLVALAGRVGELEAAQAHPPPPPAAIDLVAAAWAPGVYRDGATVQHFVGQVFVAVKDTAEEPGAGVDWRRVGTGGFRHRGVAQDGVTYGPGDIVIRDGSSFWHDGQAFHLFAMRGKAGGRGEPGRAIVGPQGIEGPRGESGVPGQRGAPGERGAGLAQLEVRGGRYLVAIFNDGQESPIDLAVELVGRMSETETTADSPAPAPKVAPIGRQRCSISF